MWILGAVVVIALIVLVVRASKKNTTIVPVPLPNPVVSSGSGSGSTVTIPGETIRAITLALFDDMDGFNYLGHNMKPYEDLLTGSDSLIVSVYNDFNTLYIGQNKGTLRDWIEDENFNQFGITDALLMRFNSLNLQ